MSDKWETIYRTWKLAAAYAYALGLAEWDHANDYAILADGHFYIVKRIARY